MPSSTLNQRHATPLAASPHPRSNHPSATADVTDEAVEADRAFHAALERVYRDEAPRLTRYFRKRVTEPEDAVDLVQESFARLASQMCRRALMHPASYLQRIAQNLLFDRAKSDEIKLRVICAADDTASSIAVEPTQAQAIEADDLMKLYRAALDALPERTRMIFILHRGDELPYKNIALQLNISIPTVQYHVAKALVHIATALDVR